MSTFSGTSIPINASSNAKFNAIVDELMTPRLMIFRQVNIRDEQAALLVGTTYWQTTFGNWLTANTPKVRKNGKPLAAADWAVVSAANGTFTAGTPTVGLDNRPRDSVEISYQFDYFPIAVLEGFIKAAISTANTAGVGAPTDYDIDTVPTSWYGVITDLAFAMCMERLIADYTMWQGRVIFALSPQAQEGEGGDVVSQLETLKHNAEERAYITLDNERFKTGFYVAPPTATYYMAVNGIGRNGTIGGRYRGMRRNRYV